jgi:hypothetical protein
MLAWTTASPDSLKELRAFLSSKRFPLSWEQSIECNVHNPDTMQREHPIPQNLAHAPDLSIASFGEDDTESSRTESINPAEFGRTVENENSLSHVVNERLIESMID